MASIQEKILDEFIEKLANTEGFTENRMQRIRELFSGRKKPKAADVIKVFSENPKEEMA